MFLVAEGAHACVGVLHARVARGAGAPVCGGGQGGRPLGILPADAGLHPPEEGAGGLLFVTGGVHLVVVLVGARRPIQAAGGALGWKTREGEKIINYYKIKGALDSFTNAFTVSKDLSIGFFVMLQRPLPYE